MDYIKFFSGHTIMSLRVVGAVAVVISILLSGCALAPGHYLDTDEIVGDSSLENSQVEFIPITPDVIAGEITGRTVATVPAELLAFEPGNYRIGPSDGLFITVWDHPELTAPSGMQLQGEANGRTVGPDGQLFYPYIGNIKAAGKTIDELRTEIAQRLTKYIEDPQVDVNVFRFSSQHILLSGAFQKTMPIPVTTRPLSLVEALGQAGVNAPDADLSSVSLIRNGKNYVLDIYALTSQPSDIHRVYLQDGDSIHLPYNDTNKVYVMGEIMRPQALKFKSDSMNLTDAIGSAGGLSQVTAKGQDVYVIRGVENLAEQKAKVFQLNAKSPSAFILSGMFQLQPQDVVYVGAAGITRWNRVMSQMLPSLTILNMTSRTAQSIDTMNNQ